MKDCNSCHRTRSLREFKKLNKGYFNTCNDCVESGNTPPAKIKPKKRKKKRLSKAAFQKKYLAYIKSPRWKKKRDKAIKRDKHKCKICGATRDLRVHHLDYDTLFHENLKSLITVCVGCHNDLHNGEDVSVIVEKMIAIEFNL